VEDEVELGRPRLIVQRGDVLGVALPRPEREQALSQALRREGMELAEPSAPGAQEMEFVQECEEENPRPCELTIVTDRIAELAQEAGVPADQIHTMKDRGAATEDEIRDTLKQVIDRMPEGEVRAEAQDWWEAAFVPGPE
jgi:hypothetical protein